METSVDLFNRNEILKDLEKYAFSTKVKGNKSVPVKGVLHENLAVLSKEFDSLGLCPLELETTLYNILEQVVCDSRNLVHIHRNSLTHISAQTVNSTNQNARKNELYNQLDKYKETLEKNENKCMSLQNRIYELENKLKEVQKSQRQRTEEIQRLKIFHSAKLSELEVRLRKLRSENEHLKNICKGNMTLTMEEHAQSLMNNEKEIEFYMKTIKTLQEKNMQLMEEILDLRNAIFFMHID